VTLQRIVIDLRSEAGEMVLRVLYRSKGDSNPGTVRRRREVSNLVRTGLQDALRALDSEAGRVDVVGTSGYTTREDVLCTTSRESAPESVHKKLKNGA
jgi:hypothetical protein